MNVQVNSNKEILPVIDAHVHIFPNAIADKARDSVGAFYDMPMFTTGTIEELYKVRKETYEGRQIVMQVIFSPAMSASQTKSINNFIAKTCEEDKNLIGFGTLHVDNDDYKDEIKRIVKLGLKGVKFHSDFQQTDIDDARMIPIYKEIATNNLPVVFHMGDKKLKYSSVDKLYNVLEAVPDLVVIAAHMGGFMHWKEAYEILKPSDRLYFDISSTLEFISGYELKLMMQKFGSSQFFFGSDFPMWSPFDELAKLDLIGLSPEEQRKVEYDNFNEFIKDYCNYERKIS